MKKIYFLAFGYSFFGSLGLQCFLNYYIICCFDERHSYPYLYGFSILAGIFSLVSCILLLIFNIIKIKKESLLVWKTIGIEFVIVLLSFVPLLIVWTYLLDFIGNIF